MTPPPDRSSASYRVAAGILGSRITGLVREGVFAHFFGVSPVADAWGVALRTPNVLQVLLGEGTLSASFIPIYAELLEEGRKKEAARFAGAVFGLLTVAAGLLAVLGILLAPWIVRIVAGGFAPELQETTTGLVRILFPMTASLAVSAWALGVLNTHRRFFLSYAAPIAWNAAMIVAMVGGGWVWELSGEALANVLAWGAVAGGALQLGILMPVAVRLLGEFRPSLATKAEGVAEAFRNFVPMVSARGAVNLSGLLDVALASYLASGAIALLRYAQTLYILPISLFGLSVAAAELPELSRIRSQGREALARDVGRGIERVAYFLIPSALAYLFLGDAISAVIYGRGAFGPTEVLATWGVLGAYALGMPASAVSRLLSSAFYAMHDTRTPARVAYLRVALSFGVGAALMFPLDRLGVGELRLGAAGLALGATVGAWTELLLLRRALQRTIGPHGSAPGTFARIWLAAGSGCAAGLAAGLLLAGTPPLIQAAGTLLPFGGVYFVATILLGVSEPLQGLRPNRRPKP
ncbi:MAG: murein biosynthesis integral membrane protein MurJ [Gemmatimonadota bacterium]